MFLTSHCRRLFCVAALFASLCVHGARGDDAPDPQAAYKKARAELVPRLEALAAWCGAEKLPLDRRRALDAILAIDPDNAGARKAVRSTKGKDGKWTPPAAPPAGRTDVTRLGDVKGKRDEAIGAFKTSVLELAAAADVSIAVREQAVGELLGVSPDDDDARTANHEERSGDGWGLVETGAARIRRRELIGAVEEARAKCPVPEKSTANAFELALAPKWFDVRVVPAVRVLAAPNAFEAEPVARTVTVARGIYEAALGATPPDVPDLRMFLFAEKDEAFAAIDRDARAPAEERKFARTLMAWWVPKENDVYIWAATGAERVEWGLRYAVATYVQMQLGIKARQGWVWEGVGHWFADVVCGTHKTWFVRRSEYADAANATDALRKRLTDGPSDWLGEGRDLEKSGRWPDLRVALGRDVNAMTTEDLLVSYLLARYLIEGRRADVADVLRSAGKGEAAEAWVASRLGMTVEGLDRRLRRWVRESR